MYPNQKELKSSELTRAAGFIVICSGLLFSILWIGSDSLWRATILQAFVLTAFMLNTTGRVYDGRPLIPGSPLNRPILALVILIVFSYTVAWNKGQAFDALIQLLICIAGFFLFVDIGAQKHYQVRLVTWVGLITTGLCLYGLVIYFKVFNFPYWASVCNSHYLCGPFANHSHMAGWVEMATLLYVGHCFTRRRSLLSTITMFSMLGIMGLTLLLTQSRGGWSAVSVGALFMASTAFFHRGFRLPKRYLAYAGAMCLVAFFIALSFKPVTQRGLSVIKNEGSRLSGREIAWAGTIDMIEKNPLTGVGAGNYATMFTQFQPPGGMKRFYETHNDYLQFTAELGVLFFPVVLWLGVVFFKTGLKKLNHPSRQERWITLGAMGGVMAILVHSAVDFNLQIPSNALLFTVLAAQVMTPAPKIKKREVRKKHD